MSTLDLWTRTITPQFLAAALLLSLAPGPDNLFVMILSLTRGAAVGLCVIGGLCSGLMIYTAATASGVAAAVAAMPIILPALRLIGAIYLFYLSVAAWRSGAGQLPQLPRLTGIQAWRRGLQMNLTNPKIMLFFLAFLPPFADPQRGSIMLQIFYLGTAFTAVAAGVFMMLSLCAARLGAIWGRTLRLRIFLQRIEAAVLAALAFWLLLDL